MEANFASIFLCFSDSATLINVLLLFKFVLKYIKQRYQKTAISLNRQDSVAEVALL